MVDVRLPKLLVKFGDIIEVVDTRGESEFFVYIADIGGIQHLAKIISGKLLDGILTPTIKAEMNGTLHLLKGNPMFLHVMLKTKSIVSITKKPKNAAHLLDTDSHNQKKSTQIKNHGSIDIIDKLSLCEEILGSPDAFPKPLTQAIKTIQLNLRK